MDKSQDGSVRVGAPARWRSSYGNSTENLEKVGWGVIPDQLLREPGIRRFGEQEHFLIERNNIRYI